MTATVRLVPAPANAPFQGSPDRSNLSGYWVDGQRFWRRMSKARMASAKREGQFTRRQRLHNNQFRSQGIGCEVHEVGRSSLTRTICQNASELRMVTTKPIPQLNLVGWVQVIFLVEIWRGSERGEVLRNGLAPQKSQALQAFTCRRGESLVHFAAGAKPKHEWRGITSRKSENTCHGRRIALGARTTEEVCFEFIILVQ